MNHNVFWPLMSSLYVSGSRNWSLLEFNQVVLDEYGIELNLTEDGIQWQQKWIVRDEAKYTMFLLKYTK